MPLPGFPEPTSNAAQLANFMESYNAVKAGGDPAMIALYDRLFQEDWADKDFQIGSDGSIMYGASYGPGVAGHVIKGPDASLAAMVDEANTPTGEYVPPVQEAPVYLVGGVRYDNIDDATAAKDALDNGRVPPTVPSSGGVVASASNAFPLPPSSGTSSVASGGTIANPNTGIVPPVSTVPVVAGASVSSVPWWKKPAALGVGALILYALFA